MGKIISTLALFIMILLFPIAALITISQDAAPGDMTYPIKRSLEDAILYLAALNPTTKAYFAVAQANRRYEEAETLLAKGVDANSSLQALVSQTTVAANDINNISSAVQRAKLIADLSSSIEKYDLGLAQAQQQIERNATLQTTDSKIESSQAPAPTPTTNSQASAQIATPTPSPQATSKPQPPKQPEVTPASEPSAQPTPKPTFRPTPKPTMSPEEIAAKKKQEEIERARKELEELRRKLEEEKRKLQQAAQKSDSNLQTLPSPSSSLTPKPSPSPNPSQVSTFNFSGDGNTFGDKKSGKEKSNSGRGSSSQGDGED